MTHPTRRQLIAATGATVLFSALGTSRAQTGKFPNRPIRIIVPVAAGGGVDLISRTIGARIGEQMGVPVLIENRPGGNTVTGTQMLAKSPADGYTLIMASPSHATNPALMGKVPYDPVKDFTALNYICYIPGVLEVNPNVPVNTVAELVALAKAQPGRLSFGYGATGAPSHILGELFRRNTSISVLAVPYKGNAPALTDLIGGQITMYFDIITTSLPHIKAGKLKALAVTGQRRSALLPDVPTMEEAGFRSIDAPAWYMLLAPAGTPADVVAVLNHEINEAIKHPDVARLSSQGVEFVGGTPAQADTFLRTEVERWSKFIKEVGIKAE